MKDNTRKNFFKNYKSCIKTQNTIHSNKTKTTQDLDFIHAKDVADAISFILKKMGQVQYRRCKKIDNLKLANIATKHIQEKL